jgi:tetratricopeptide (TPR) repeat protein
MLTIKRRIILYITIGLAALLIVGGMIVSGNVAANSPARILSLGEQFLLDLDYENAIVQFLKVIEIEPMNERAYLGATEAYIGLGQTEEAMAMLEQGLTALPDSAAILAMLEVLIAQQEALLAEQEALLAEQAAAEAAAARDADPNNPANWTDLNGMPIFDADYVTDVMGIPAGAITIYDIPGINAETIFDFEAKETSNAYISGEGLWSGITLNGEVVDNHFGIIAPSTYGADTEGYTYDIHYDGRIEEIDFLNPSPERLWGFSHLYDHAYNATPAGILNNFRIENPQALEFLKDPTGYYEAWKLTSEEETLNITLYEKRDENNKIALNGTIEFRHYEEDGYTPLFVTYTDYTDVAVDVVLEFGISTNEGESGVIDVYYSIEDKDA